MQTPVKVYTIYRDSHVFIEETHGTIDHPLRARTQDFYFGGSGNTPNECLIGVIQSMREAADKLEEQVEEEE